MGRDARHGPGERERSGLRAGDAEGGRLGDDRRIEACVALERGERSEAAVLLGRDGLDDDLRAVAHGRRGVQRRDQRALHVR
jgi:hypothetical protein